jgi:hypothetical protein
MLNETQISDAYHALYEAIGDERDALDDLLRARFAHEDLVAQKNTEWIDLPPEKRGRLVARETAESRKALLDLEIKHMRAQARTKLAGVECDCIAKLLTMAGLVGVDDGC